jgi:guanylate kinase
MSRIIITGPSCSGKDTLRKRFQAKGFSYGRLHTTRPKRAKETDEYIFCEQLPFEEYLLFQFKFGPPESPWKYALSKSEWRDNDLFIFSPPYFDALPEARDAFVFLLRPSNDVLLSRAAKERSDSPQGEVERRFAADITTFNEFEKQHIHNITLREIF